MLSLYWTLTNLLGVFIPPGIFTEQRQVELIEVDYEKDLYDQMSLSEKDLYVAYKFEYDGDDIAEGEIENYVSGVWFQYISNEKEPRSYKPVDCDSVPFIAQSSKYD